MTQQELDDTLLTDFGMCKMTANALHNGIGVDTIGQLAKISLMEAKKVYFIGAMGMNQIKHAIKEYREQSEKIAAENKKTASQPDFASISDSLARIVRAFEIIAVNVSVAGTSVYADDCRKAYADYIQHGITKK